MFDTSRFAVLAAVLLVASLAAPAAAMGVAAQDQTPTPENNTTTTPTPTPSENESTTARKATAPANLAIRQPEYVDGTVAREGSETPIYLVEGREQLIRPQNFDADDVVHFGVTTDHGQLTYDPQMRLYVFESEGHTGSFEVYWETSEHRFEATIRVTDGGNVAVVNADAYQNQKADAEEWRQWNSTLDDIYEQEPLLWSLFGTPSRPQLLQGLVDVYMSVNDPGAHLGGTYLGAALIVFLSIGGILFYITTQAGPGAVIYILKKKLHWTEINEAHEGEMLDRKVQMENKERQEVFANIDWQDIPGFTDHTAAGFREFLAQDPLEGYPKQRGATSIMTAVRDRLRAMSQNGYAARKVSPDGGTESGQYELVHVDDVLEGDETVDDRDDLVTLEDPDAHDDLVEDVKDSDVMWRDFDLSEAEIDYSEFDESMESIDLEQLIEELDPPMYYFDSKADFGRHMVQFLRYVEEHNITDDDGAIDSFRAFANLMLRQEQYFGDVHGVPGARARADAWERALIDHDLGEKTNKWVSDLQDGRDVL